MFVCGCMHTLVTFVVFVCFDFNFPSKHPKLYVDSV